MAKDSIMIYNIDDMTPGVLKLREMTPINQDTSISHINEVEEEVVP